MTTTNLKDLKFAELKEMAAKFNWASMYDGPRKNFIGVKKDDVITFIEFHEAKLAEAAEEIAPVIVPPIEALKSEIETSGKPADPAPATDMITLKVVASMLGITEKSLRRKLRQKGAVKPGGRWEWTANHPYIETIKSWKGEA